MEKKKKKKKKKRNEVYLPCHWQEILGVWHGVRRWRLLSGQELSCRETLVVLGWLCESEKKNKKKIKKNLFSEL